MNKSRLYVFMVMGGVIIIITCGLCLLFAGPYCSDPKLSSENISLVSDVDISQIIINDIWFGMPGREVYTYTITRIDPNLPLKNIENFEGTEFMANVRVEKITWQGEYTRTIDEYQQVVDSNKIANLNNSLINLRESALMLSCYSHTDDYPEVKIEITYNNGKKVGLYSNSNCFQSKPWNVIAENKIYIQYTGEVPKAYSDFMGGIYNMDTPDYFDFDYKYEFHLRKIPEEFTDITRDYLFIAGCL